MMPTVSSTLCSRPSLSPVSLDFATQKGEDAALRRIVATSRMKLQHKDVIERTRGQQSELYNCQAPALENRALKSAQYTT
eukprot:1541256-Amphidinium_carterae.1